ncbi:uncharacterized protein [Bemisia tabaci]|uniref:uncharacterized protein isoform X2 n=1 Tax=Bemisia tabaci TaxID=7038 RepID=UPI003B28D3F1
MMFLWSHFMKQLGFTLSTYNFSEAGHGKSVADGVGGTIKGRADSCVRQGNDINSIDTFLEAVNKTKVYVARIEESDICVVDDILKSKQLDPIPGTMKLHQVVTLSTNFNKLHLRYLSCIECRDQFDCKHFQHLGGILESDRCPGNS